MVKVKVRKGALDYFRRLARSTPLEIQSYLVGEVLSPTEVRIDYFAYPKEYHTQTSNSVVWTREEFDALRVKAQNEGLQVFGDIHTHPAWDSVMSPDDYKGAIVEGLRICGICSVNNNRTRVRFWIPDSALCCQIVYT